MKYVSLGKASQLTGKSKPTISAACKPKLDKNGKQIAPARLTAIKEDGQYKIELSELYRLYEPLPEKGGKVSVNPRGPIPRAVAEVEKKYLEEKVSDLEERLVKMEAERDAAMAEAKEANTRAFGLLEDSRRKGFWKFLTG